MFAELQDKPRCFDDVMLSLAGQSPYSFPARNAYANDIGLRLAQLYGIGEMFNILLIGPSYFELAELAGHPVIQDCIRREIPVHFTVVDRSEDVIEFNRRVVQGGSFSLNDLLSKCIATGGSTTQDPGPFFSLEEARRKYQDLDIQGITFTESDMVVEPINPAINIDFIDEDLRAYLDNINENARRGIPKQSFNLELLHNVLNNTCNEPDIDYIKMLNVMDDLNYLLEQDGIAVITTDTAYMNYASNFQKDFVNYASTPRDKATREYNYKYDFMRCLNGCFGLATGFSPLIGSLDFVRLQGGNIIAENYVVVVGDTSSHLPKYISVRIKDIINLVYQNFIRLLNRETNSILGLEPNIEKNIDAYDFYYLMRKNTSVCFVQTNLHGSRIGDYIKKFESFHIRSSYSNVFQKLWQLNNGAGYNPELLMQISQMLRDIGLEIERASNIPTLNT